MSGGTETDPVVVGSGVSGLVPAAMVWRRQMYYIREG
jgi:hypothetical protein